MRGFRFEYFSHLKEENIDIEIVHILLFCIFCEDTILFYHTHRLLWLLTDLKMIRFIA